jgi:8-oxo-dGTP diphosphatase
MPGNPVESEIIEKYGNRLRIRVCGICWKADQLLMVNHKHLTQGDFWAPPGGGLEFGQSIQNTLTREFKEEAGITIQPGNMLFICEFIKPPLHALELFFASFYDRGELITGTDPETNIQLIREVAYMDFNTIMSIPANERHGIFNSVKTIQDFRKLNGFYRI